MTNPHELQRIGSIEYELVELDDGKLAFECSCKRNGQSWIDEKRFLDVDEAWEWFDEHWIWS